MSKESIFFALGVAVVILTLGGVIYSSYEIQKERSQIEIQEKIDEFESGKKAALEGIPPTACPWSDRYGGHKRTAWMKGWADGHRELQKEKQ